LGAQISRTLALAAEGRARRPVESNDDYPHIVVMLDAETRVIECADGIQWIIHRRCRRKDGRVTWNGKYFCRTKEGLLLYAKSDAPELLALPDYFPERAAA
jgi:hypothetical protein